MTIYIHKIPYIGYEISWLEFCVSLECDTWQRRIVKNVDDLINDDTLNIVYK